MSFGFGFGLPRAPLRGRPLVAAIRSLFAANEPGVWYDPSDLSTLYQDSAGTTPVTAVEQPVGLLLDKSKGLVLGPELVTNGTFDSDLSGWFSLSGASISRQAGRIRVERTDGSNYPCAAQNLTLVSGSTYRLSCTYSNPFNIPVFFSFFGVVKNHGTASSGVVDFLLQPLAPSTQIQVGILALTGAVGQYIEFDNISVRELPGNHAYQPTTTSRPVLSARVNQYLATEMLATQNVTTLAAQYRLSFEGAGTITLSGTATGVYSAGSHLITCTAGTLTSTVSGSVTKADLRVANDGANLPPYQRVNTATDYDTVGFPPYLRFDGVDDWLVTPTITPGIDKAQVFAGVRKLSDAAVSILYELSANANLNNGAFYLAAPESTGVPNYAWKSRGDVNTPSFRAATFTAPVTNVFTGLGDISSDSAFLRINGVQAAQSTADQGAGNYLAYPLYIGRRGGTTLPFNGRLYSLIVRFGSNLPDATIEKTEKYINTKTRAY